MVIYSVSSVFILS